MKKMIDLIAGPGTHKDSKLLDYIRKNYLVNNMITNMCFISGQGSNDENHIQPSASELYDLVFNKNDKNTIYFLRSFYFGIDRDNYLKVIEKMCEEDIQIFKTDQVKEHVTSDEEWLNKYCKFLLLEDLDDTSRFE